MNRKAALQSCETMKSALEKATSPHLRPECAAVANVVEKQAF